MSDPITQTPSTGDIIGQNAAVVGEVISPIVSALNPAVGPLVSLAFQVFAKVEPAAWNAVAAMLQKQDLTPEQQAAIDAVAAKLQDTDSYLQ